MNLMADTGVYFKMVTPGQPRQTIKTLWVCFPQMRRNKGKKSIEVKKNQKMNDVQTKENVRLGRKFKYKTISSA